MAKKLSKTFVIADYQPSKSHAVGKAMYNSNDTCATKESTQTGEFFPDKTVKGEFNGYEIGIFVTDDHKLEYLIFHDYSARLREPVGQRKVNLEIQLQSEMAEIVVGKNMDNPDFAKAEKIHDWRNYVPQLLQDNWSKLTGRERMIIAILADKRASNEEWD